MENYSFPFSVLCLLAICGIMMMSMPVSAQYTGGKNPVVKPGIEVLLTQKIDLVKNKRVGLITNPTGIDSNFRSSIDLLHQCKDVKLAALFGPEHGIRGDFFAGEKVTNDIDPITGVKVYSLYGGTFKPTAEMLENIDCLLYDIQDTGCRGYTFIYTMAYGMQAAKEYGKKFIVLDRPNPLGGNLVDGNILDPQFASFVGLYPIAYSYGMTPGELALYFNKECNINCDLSVVKMDGWKRSMKYWDTGLPWIPPSMHIPRVDTPFYSAITGILGELNTVNEGVGYTLPFEVVGAPWIDAYQLADELNKRNLPGVFFRPVSYEPRYYVFSKQKCKGVQIHILDYNTVMPVSAGIHIMEAIQKLYPDKKLLAPANAARIDMFDKVMGTDTVRKALASGKTADEIIKSFESQLQDFMKKRSAYLLYE